MGRGGSDDRDVSTDPAYRGDRIERNCTMGDGGNAARKLATLRYGKYSIISARLAWDGDTVSRNVTGNLAVKRLHSLFSR